MSESINYGGIFDLEVKEEELAVLEKQSADPDLWNDQDKAQALLFLLVVMIWQNFMKWLKLKNLLN